VAPGREDAASAAAVVVDVVVIVVVVNDDDVDVDVERVERVRDETRDKQHKRAKIKNAMPQGKTTGDENPSFKQGCTDTVEIRSMG